MTNAPMTPRARLWQKGQRLRYHSELGITPGDVDPDDGHMARFGTVEWFAWQDYYQRKKRYFSALLQEHYAANGVAWPIVTMFPPADK